MRYRIRNITPDVLIAALLFILPLIVFWAQTVGGKTLIPAENLYQYEPYATYREVVGAPEVPHNHLVSDLVLQNYQWKSFIRQSIAAGEVPLWNPHQFAGIPFLAAGQPSTLYPLSAIYYTMPLEWAYGWFTVVNLWLAGLTMFMFLRGIRLVRPAALVGAITYQLCGFFVASAVFPMMLGAVPWLPLLLLLLEFIIRQRPAFGRPAVIPWIVIGAAALAMNMLAGHVEITYYTILITAYYGAFRGISGYWANRRVPGAVRAWAKKLGYMLAMGVLGLALGAVQFIPLYELVQTNWRAEGKTYAETIEFAHPTRDVLLFLMPKFYGSPADHEYFDVFEMEWMPIDFVNPDGVRKTNTEWGIKNYVEGAVYVGILPLMLALYGMLAVWLPAFRGRLAGVQRAAPPSGERFPPYRAMFAILGFVALTFMFGLPTYALVYYGLPGLNQSHTPFRWVYAFTLSVAVLAAFGMETLMQVTKLRLKQVFAWALTVTGGVILAALGISFLLYEQLEPTYTQLFQSVALADRAFPSTQAFYSHVNDSLFGLAVMLVQSGFVFWLIIYAVHRRRKRNKFHDKQAFYGGRRGLWAWIRPGWMDVAVMTAIMVVGMDLYMANRDFNPASDPELLAFTPPVIEWMLEQEGDWRYLTLDDPTQRPILPANATWRYGLDDVRGYESIIPRQYVDYMRELYPQVQLDFNRIAPLYTTYENVAGYEDFDFRDALTSDRLHLLNVRYVISHRTTDISDVEGYSLAYEDEAVRVWENANAVPRAFVVTGDYVGTAFLPSATGTDAENRVPTDMTPAEIASDTGREFFVGVPQTMETVSLFLSISHSPGWRALWWDGHMSESEFDIRTFSGNFMTVSVPDPERQFENQQFRLVYSPTSFQTGFFTTAISGMLCLFLLGVWAWRRFVVSDGADGGALLARNTAAPVVLNLFNRGIDFVFAFVMLRILGPTDAGIYYYAVIVFVWFDIFTNFGLDVFLTREVSRDKSRGGHLLLNTTVFRLLLSVFGFGLLLAFIFARQNLVAEPFDARGIIALVLLYVGLVPGSLSKGMTSLYYAHERAEYPAAVSTVTTISKAVLGIVVLIAGFGIIGLAAVSIFNNLVTLAILVTGGRDMFAVPPHPPSPSPQAERGSSVEQIPSPSTGRGFRGGVNIPLIRNMANESYPLMLNHFLATIFFQIDVVILEPLRGAAIVGKYSVGYRWLLALNVIPAFFTMAIFPRLSRQADEDRAALRRNTVLSLKLLAGLVFPAAVLLTFLARPLTLLLGGREFLPEGAIALQIMVWSMPLGWMNSLTQYVLIALNRQRQITWAFVVGVTFNVVTNLIFIPIYGYRAAAVTTILSELILMVGFAALLRRDLGGVPWADVLLKPAAAAGVMSAVMVLAWGLHPVAGVSAGVVAYPVVWWLLRPLSGEEMAVLRPLLPERVRRLAVA